MQKKLRQELVDLLTKTDTPTICNAIEQAQGKRGFNRFTRKTPAAMHQSAQVAMGYARTAKIAAEHPTERSAEDNQKIRMDYYRHMSQGPRPAICVIEDTDPEPVGAYWGEVNTNVHRGLGLSGTLTNGLIRDLGLCPPDYQVIGGGIGPSHRFVHIEDIDCEVEIFGMKVAPGEFVHTDRHGACVVPEEILPELDRWIARMQEFEKIVIDPAKGKNFTFETLEAAWRELEKRRV